VPSGELEGDMSNEGIGYHLDLMVDGLGTGMVYVRSKDVPGLHLVGENFVAMKPMIEKAIKRLFLDNRGQKVRVVFLAEVAQFPKKHSRKIKELPSKVAVFPVSKAA